MILKRERSSIQILKKKISKTKVYLLIHQIEKIWESKTHC